MELLRDLLKITETADGGATSAGAIAAYPQKLFGMKKKRHPLMPGGKEMDNGMLRRRMETLDAEAQNELIELIEATLKEVSPPGWEGTVKAMKKHKEITNPWALSWYMKNKGYKSHKKIKEDRTNDLPKIAKVSLTINKQLDDSAVWQWIDNQDAATVDDMNLGQREIEFTFHFDISPNQLADFVEQFFRFYDEVDEEGEENMGRRDDLEGGRGESEAGID